MSLIISYSICQEVAVYVSFESQSISLLNLYIFSNDSIHVERFIRRPFRRLYSSWYNQLQSQLGLATSDSKNHYSFRLIMIYCSEIIGHKMSSTINISLTWFYYVFNLSRQLNSQEKFDRVSVKYKLKINRTLKKCHNLIHASVLFS